VLLCAAGCSDVLVRRAHAPDLLESWRESVVTADEISPRTLQTLRQYDLEALYRRRPAEAAARLHAEALRDSRPDLLFALAEISYLRGREAEREGGDAVAGYYLCAGYAYHYLFATADAGGAGAPAAPPLSPRDAFDPRFRLACELYNAGLAKCLAHAQRAGRLDPRQQLHVPAGDGSTFTLSVVHEGFAWKPEEFGPLLFCDDFRVTGLANQHHAYGLGVPLIGSRAADAPEPPHAFYPRSVRFPVTAFFRFEGTLADLGTCRCGRLELINPLTVPAVEARGRSVPLETDLTTPLAYFLAHTDLEYVDLKGFLSADHVRGRSGIYMFEPYQPGKIPVLMVHGLLSSPLTWAPLFNDLRADPALRERFQFWFYLYPSADPYLATAADLRQTLQRLRADLDPRHQDDALDQMVLVGHSMGGIVSHLLTVDSGDGFFRQVSARPFDELKLKPETRDELRPVFFFERQPGVKRVVFLATPHHGSRLSPALPGRLAVRLARLPRRLASVAAEAVAEDPELAHAIDPSRLPVSVDGLAPNTPALELLAARPRPEGVHYHSVIGVTSDPAAVLERVVSGDKPNDPGDGVVPYRSAHLDGVDSEVVVPADHNHVHHHPLAVREVRRILLEHAQSLEPIRPVSHDPR
jgi:pimeloyl-ACP methyl ester carboxylesterase